MPLKKDYPKTVRIPDDEWAEFRAWCVINGTSASATIRSLIRDFMLGK